MIINMQKSSHRDDKVVMNKKILFIQSVGVMVMVGLSLGRLWDKRHEG